jgi:hypothetical protein
MYLLFQRSDNRLIAKDKDLGVKVRRRFDFSNLSQACKLFHPPWIGAAHCNVVRSKVDGDSNVI